MSRDDTDSMSLIEKAAGRIGKVPSGPQPPRPAPPPGAGGAQGFARQPPPATKPGAEGAEGGGFASIDVQGLKAQGYLTPDGEKTRVAEEFRIIKRPLLENAFGRGAPLVDQGNLAVVTSALPGEGKTYTAINLAMSIAMEMDKTVLLVDADVGRAHVHEMLKIPMGPGLIDVLTGDAGNVGDVMLRTDIPKLRVIPMGRYHPHSNELLASEEMRRLTQELAQRYSDRMVIFDAPPLLATSEAVVLSNLMGQIVFVVQSERTLQSRVKDALSLVDSSKPVGLVLNKIRKGIASDYYGYGSYGYGNYGYHR